MAGARWSGGQFVLDAGSVTNEMISSSTAIDNDKLQHYEQRGTNFGFVIGGTPTAREEIVFVAPAAGSVRTTGFHACLNDTGTSTDVTFDLKKNGTTMLSGTINITHGDADKAVKDGTLSVTSFVADDIISISMAVVASTGAQGPYAWVDLELNSAP